MTLDFVQENFHIGQKSPDLSSQFIFYKKGFRLGGSASIDYKDIILSGNTALTLVNSKANGLNYVKLFGKSLLSSAPKEIDVTPRTTETPTGNYTVGTTSISSEYSSVGGNYLRYAFDGNNSTQFVQSYANPNIFLQDTQGFNFDTIMVRPGGGAYGSNFKYFALDYMSPTGWTNIATTTTLVDEWATLSGIGDTIRSLPANTMLRLHIDMYNTSEWGGFAEVKMILKRDSVVPSPDYPMDIVSNNGVVKYGYKSVNMFDKNSTLEDGVVWVNNGNTRPLSDYYGTNQIHVIGGHTYTRSGSHGNANYIKLSDETWATFNDGARTITMPDNAILWAFNNTTATSRDTMMVVEGTSLPAEYVPYEGYGIYTDGTVETVQVHGKNLWNPDGINYGWISSDGSFGIANGVSRRIEIKYGKTYTYKSYSAEGNFYNCVALYDANMNFISGSRSIITTGTTKTNTKTITNSSAKYMVCAYYISGGNIAPDQNMIYEGSMDIDYTPYYYGGSATAENLFKVGDYKDEQSVIDGSVTRKVGIKVLDGTENWDTGSSAYSNRFTLAGAFNDIAQIPNENVGYSNCYTVIARSSNIQQNLQNNECGWNTTYVFCLRDDRFTTIAQFKQYLSDQYNAGTPVIVVYPLETSTTETVTGQPLTTQEGTNIITAEGSIDNLELEVSYKATV